MALLLATWKLPDASILILNSYDTQEFRFLDAAMCCNTQHIPWEKLIFRSLI